MNTPKLTDKIVKVKAYLTDENFGYEHWQAKQFLSPENSKFSVLIICNSREEQEEVYQKLKGNK